MSKMPTKSEALEAIRDEYRAGAGGNLFEQILDRLVNLGVPFSPERVAPHRGDLLTEHTELVDDMAVRSKYGYVYVLYPLSGRWHEASASISWLTTAGLLEREPVIVDVPGESDPEPEPKPVPNVSTQKPLYGSPEPELVAERRDDGMVWVDDWNVGGALRGADYRLFANRYAAVARLREQEEREAGE